MNSPRVEEKAEGIFRRVWLRVCVVVGALLFLSQLVEIPARSALRGYDNTFNYLWLRSAMVDGDWDFRNDVEQCDTLVPEHRASALALPRTSAGRLPNKYGIGWAVITLPFYLVADGIVAVVRFFGGSIARDGFGPIYQIVIQTGHALLAVLALILATRTIGRWIDNHAAAIGGVILVWAASPLTYYQTVNLSMSHGAAFLCIVVFASALETARRCPDLRWPWLLAGAALGLAVITRFQLAIFGLVALWALASRAQCGRRITLPTTLFAAAAMPFVLLQLWAWRVVYGQWLLFSYGAEGEGFHWGRPELLNALFSSWHGLYYWHPFLLIATLGMFGWAWTQRSISLGWCASFLAAMYVSAAWWCWWFASSFGNRSLDAAMLPLMAGVAWLLSRGSARWQAMIWTTGTVAGLWNIYLVVLFRSGAISRHDPVSWREMLDAAGRLREAIHF